MLRLCSCKARCTEDQSDNTVRHICHTFCFFLGGCHETLIRISLFPPASTVVLASVEKCGSLALKNS